VWIMSSRSSHRFFAIGLLAGLLVLLALFLAGLGGDVPELPRLSGERTNRFSQTHSARMEEIFTADRVTRFSGMTAGANPFYTTYFDPPEPAPPGQAPSTRKVRVLYQGFFESANGEKQAYVRIDDELKIGGPGTVLVADLVIAGVGLRSLVLTNAEAETNVLSFSREQELEVPAD
jgi:hypothetical protein